MPGMRYFEDFTMGARERTAARTLTETHVIQFCMLTGDWYPLHADKEWAEKEGPFGRRIAHGFLVLSFASGLMPLAEMAIVAFYGMDKVRFIAPTFLDDTLHVETEVVGLDDKGARQDITPLPKGGLDGLASTGDSLLVTSWQGSAIYRGKLGQKFEVAFPGLKGAADIAYDAKRKRVIVPRFVDNAIEAYDLK